MERFFFARGASHLFEDETPTRCFSALRQCLQGGSRGLCISRTHPDRLKEEYSLDNVEFVWVAKVEAIPGATVVPPEQMLRLYSIITEFVRSAPETVVMMDCLEYLIVQNDFRAILKLLQLVNEQVTIYKSLLLVYIKSDVLDPKDVALLSREIVPHTTHAAKSMMHRLLPSQPRSGELRSQLFSLSAQL